VLERFGRSTATPRSDHEEATFLECSVDVVHVRRLTGSRMESDHGDMAPTLSITSLKVVGKSCQ
jgi:hypothetical protein